MMRHYDIEIVDACNLKCPSCPRGNSLDVPRARGHMKLDLFEQVLAKIVRENPSAASIGLFNWGEPLLHPNLPEIVRAVKRYGLTCDLSSNLNVVKNLEEVIAAGPDHFRVSLSGFQQKNYSLTHKTGNIETVKTNMRALRAVIDNTGSSCEVQVLFHMYLHNMEEDFALMRAFCRELRFTMNPVWAYLMPVEKVLAYYGGTLPEKDQAVVDLLVIKPEEAREVSKRHPLRDCPLRADQLAINANGSVPLCCGVFEPKNTVAISFLDIGPAELKKARYGHDLCRTCMANSIHSTATYQGLDELNRIAEARFRERGLNFRFSSSIAPFIEVEDLNGCTSPQPLSWKERGDTMPTLPASVASDREGSGEVHFRATPKLSILIPTYNRAEMLRECLESSLTAPAESEIVVIDNGSTDDTAAVTQSFVNRDPRVRVVRQVENVGPLRNFQTALEEARGQFICLTGDDDLFLPGNFEKKLGLLDACPEIGLVYSQWLRIDEQSRSQGVVMWPGLLPYSYVGTRDEFRDLLPASYMMFQSVVFRRELYDRFGGFDEHPDRLVGNDWDLLLRYCYHAKTAFIAEPLVAVRVHPQSFTESVARKEGKFAPGRVAIWRKWLVEHENPPVLDDALWRRMADAFVPDLGYEFGQDQARIDDYLQQLERVKQDSMLKIAQVAQAKIWPSAASAVSRVTPVVSPDAIVRASASDGRPRGSNSGLPAITWTGPLFEASSAGEAARSLLSVLEGAGCQIAAEPCSSGSRRAAFTQKEEAWLREMAGRTPRRDAVHICNSLPPDFKPRADARINIGIAEFCSDRLPKGWAEACIRMDQIWVPSEFNRETFARAGVDMRKLCVMPGPIHVSEFSDCLEQRNIAGARGFNFLSVFDWELRSGWDILVRAFVEEFHRTEDVALILQTRPSCNASSGDSEIGRQLIAFLRDSLGRDPEEIPDILLETEELLAPQLPSLYRAADCFVSATHGEPWGRRYIEAMASGLPVIGTNWGGPSEFMTAENCFLVESVESVVTAAAVKEMPELAGHRWAEPNEDQLRRQMRRAFESREAAAQVGLTGQRYVSARFSDEIFGSRYMQMLSRLSGLIREAA